jgi:hypothetical protein
MATKNNNSFFMFGIFSFVGYPMLLTSVTRAECYHIIVPI